MANDYSWSFDGEHFTGEFATPEEAVQDARNYDSSQPIIFVGENELFRPRIDGICAIEAMQEQADDEVGDVAEIYLENVSDDDAEKLGDLLTDTFNRWAKETGNEPNIFPVVNVEMYIVGDLKDE